MSAVYNRSDLLTKDNNQNTVQQRLFALLIQLAHYAVAVACNTIDTDGTLWNCISHVVFSDLLLCTLYTKLYKPLHSDNDFRWRLPPFSQHAKAQLIITQFLARPPRYEVDAVKFLSKNLPNTCQFGFALHSRFGGVVIDLVRTDPATNKFEPLIVVSDKFGSKYDNNEEFMNHLKSRATLKQHWIARMDSRHGVIYNVKHPSYIRILLAMQVLNTTSGTVILYNVTNQRHAEFAITERNNEHIDMIKSVEFYFYELFEKAVGGGGGPAAIPTLEFSQCQPRSSKPYYEQLRIQAGVIEQSLKLSSSSSSSSIKINNPKKPTPPPQEN